jgi:hypothetical protein
MAYDMECRGRLTGQVLLACSSAEERDDWLRVLQNVVVAQESGASSGAKPEGGQTLGVGGGSTTATAGGGVHDREREVLAQKLAALESEVRRLRREVSSPAPSGCWIGRY